MKLLEDKVALVTGASKGIGRAIALAMADVGADVIATARTEGELKELCEAIRAKGRRGEYILADLRSTEEAKAMARKALQIFGRVDILVNNAGVSYPQPALETSEDRWDETFQINLKSLFFLTQIIGKGMMEQGGGKIINIASQAGLVGLEDHAAYCATKGGLILLTKVLAIEWGKYKINVNAVAPTIIMTPMAEKAWADVRKREEALKKIPIGRFGMPEDVVGAVIFLASPYADLITGVVLPIDGGYTAQ